MRNLGGTRRPGRGLGGSEICRCPGCGHTQRHPRGIPCSTLSCSVCGARLQGERCADKAVHYGRAA